MLIELDAIEARILGALVEKSITTPEQYPLSFNALLNACNQKTSRDPVMNLDIDALGRSVATLIEKDLAERRSGSRVPKFLHHVDRLFDGGDPRVAGIVCVLLLRGPQTAGELKARTDRMCTFANAGEVESLLQDLAARPDGPFIARLPKQPGRKETRYRQLFTGGAPDAPAAAVSAPAQPDRMSRLEQRVAALEQLCRSIQERLDGGEPSAG
ncbi:MAG: YceH family protein [Elusimicrobiota bacterium]